MWGNGGLMFDIKDFIRSDAVFVDSQCQIAKAARLLYTSGQIVLPVVNQCLEPIGILTEKDILAWLYNGRKRDAKVTDCMRVEFTTLDDKTGLIDMVYIFAGENYREIPVVSNGVLTGLIKRGDVIKYLLDKRTTAGKQAKNKIECGK